MKNKAKKEMNTDDLLTMLKKPSDETKENKPEKKGPATLLDALEHEMKEAKIVEEKVPTEKIQKVEKTEAKLIEEIPTKTEMRPGTPKISKKSKSQKAPEKVESEPVYKMDDSDPAFCKIIINIPNATMAEAELQVSDKLLKFRIPKMYKIDIPLPDNLKDEATKARFNKEKCKLTLKIPKFEIQKAPEQISEDMFDKDFLKQLQSGLSKESHSSKAMKTSKSKPAYDL